MNKVEILSPAVSSIKYGEGDIFKEKQSGEINILACVDFKMEGFYCFIALEDGNRYNNPLNKTDILELIEKDFEFLGRDAKIEITFN